MGSVCTHISASLGDLEEQVWRDPLQLPSAAPQSPAVLLAVTWMPSKCVLPSGWHRTDWSRQGTAGRRRAGF